MFDPVLYQKIMDAANSILSQKVNHYGNQFCNEFLMRHDPNRGQEAQSNAMRLQQYVQQEYARMSGITGSITTQQFFDIIYAYIENVFRNVAQQQQQPFYAGGNNQNLFGGGNMFSNSSNTAPLMPSSHLGGSAVPQTPQYVAPQVFHAPQPEPVVMTTGSSFTGFKAHPLEETVFPDRTSFTEVPATDCWAGEIPRDNTFVVHASHELKSSDTAVTFRDTKARSKLVFDDNFGVVKKFFKVAPESILSKNLMFTIEYDHLEIIDVPTEDLLRIIEELRESLLSGRSTIPFYRQVVEIAGTLKRGAWKSLDAYLVKHINRALHLSCRTHSNPQAWVRIKELEDLLELLSSTYTSTLTSIPDGRNKIKQIVEYAIVNALWLNSYLMFATDNDEDWKWGVKLMKTSSAFPDSIPNVYPSKTSLPDSPLTNGDFPPFKEMFRSEELSRVSYILSRRSVTITNVLGPKVLSNLTDNVFKANGIVPHMFRKITNEHLRDSTMINDSRRPAIRETTAETSLREYYENPSHDDRDIHIENHGRYTSSGYVDRYIYAIEFHGNPMDYLTSMDVISFMDGFDDSEPCAFFTKRNVQTLIVR